MSLVTKKFQRIADRIDTGIANAETSRALVVFNFRTDGLVSCSAVFPVAMAWPASTPFPAITVIEKNGLPVPSAVRFYQQLPDMKGRDDYHHLMFELWFNVHDVPPRGWKTYIAAFSETSGMLLTDFKGLHGVLVAETTRHGGDLPVIGRF